MSRVIRILALVCVATSMFFGCASKSVFVYDRPEMKATAAPGRVLLCRETADVRTDRDLDSVYEKETIVEVRTIIEEEMMSTGLFEKVVWTAAGRESQESVKPAGNQLVLDTSLNDLKWEVPGYESILAISFVTTFATGAIGGLIYGFTDADVNGMSRLTARLVDPSSGKTLLDKQYTGKHATSKVKFSCDTPDTKAEVAGKALKHAMEQLKVDLHSALRDGEPAAGAVSEKKE